MNEPVRSAERATDAEEASLLARAREGDRGAIDALVRRHLGAVYELTVRVLGDRDLAQDAAQDAFVNALNALPRFRGESSFRTWLLRIALNAARSHGRRQTRRKETVLEAAEQVADSAPDHATRIADRDEAKLVEAQLARLPEKQRLAVSLRLQQGLSHAEVAEALDCTEGAARVNYHLGIKRLRELMRCAI